MKKLRVSSSEFRDKLGMTIMLLAMVLALAGGAGAQQNINPVTLTLAAGETRYVRLALADMEAISNPLRTPKPFVCWKVVVDTITAGSTPIDSLALSYCKAWGSAAGDTLALRATAGVRRYACSYTGGLALVNLDAAFVWVSGGKYCMVINQDGVPYFWMDLKIVNSSFKSYRMTLSMETAGVQQ